MDSESRGWGGVLVSMDLIPTTICFLHAYAKQTLLTCFYQIMIMTSKDQLNTTSYTLGLKVIIILKENLRMVTDLTHLYLNILLGCSSRYGLDWTTTIRAWLYKLTTPTYLKDYPL